MQFFESIKCPEGSEIDLNITQPYNSLNLVNKFNIKILLQSYVALFHNMSSSFSVPKGEIFTFEGLFSTPNLQQFKEEKLYGNALLGLASYDTRSYDVAMSLVYYTVSNQIGLNFELSLKDIVNMAHFWDEDFQCIR